MFSQNGLKSGFGWICLGIGLLAYFLGYTNILPTELGREIAIKVGDVFIIGVVVGYLSNAAQFLGLFKKDLQDIIYGKEFLKVRNDITTLWETVTKEMFKSKFPAINKELLTKIKQTYLPVENPIYYNEYNTSINVEWIDKERHIIKVTHAISFELIADTTKKIEFPLRSWIDIEGLDASDYSVTVSQYTVNDKPATILKTTNEVRKNQHFFEQIIELKGCNKYEISKSIEKQYSLDKDYTIGFRALYIINKLNVNFSCPEDMNYLFYSRGTIDEFKTLSENKSSFVKSYKGLLFKNQGYIIALNNSKK